MDSLNGLDRLLGAEAKATELIKAAENEASSILSQAQEDIHKIEKTRLMDERLTLEKEYLKNQADIAATMKSRLEEYTALLESTPMDEVLFEKSCKNLISQEA
jgi:vacuolar-type H+-ATPase subunit H